MVNEPKVTCFDPESPMEGQPTGPCSASSSDPPPDLAGSEEETGQARAPAECGVSSFPASAAAAHPVSPRPLKGSVSPLAQAPWEALCQGPEGLLLQGRAQDTSLPGLGLLLAYLLSSEVLFL